MNTLIMKKVLHKKNWNMGTVQVHMELPIIPLIKGKNDDKSDIDFVKIKLRRDLMSEKSDIFEFKMALPVTLMTSANIQYICNMVCG